METPLDGSHFTSTVSGIVLLVETASFSIEFGFEFHISIIDDKPEELKNMNNSQ